MYFFLIKKFIIFIDRNFDVFFNTTINKRNTASGRIYPAKLFGSSINLERLTIKNKKIIGGYFLEELEEAKQIKQVTPDKKEKIKIE